MFFVFFSFFLFLSSFLFFLIKLYYHYIVLLLHIVYMHPFCWILISMPIESVFQQQGTTENEPRCYIVISFA